MKNIILFVIIIFLLNSLVIYSQTQKIYFGKISIDNGLSQNSVLAICQDKKGFLWFGSYDGLNRYDGLQFRIFKHIRGDSTSLIQNLVRVVYEDHLDNLWIGTEAGLSKYNPETESFTNYHHDPKNAHSISNDRISSITEDSNNNLWIGTEGGLNIFDYEKNTFTKFYNDPQKINSLSNNFIWCIFHDSFGKLWIGTNDGLNLYDYDEKKFIRFKNNPNDRNSLSDNKIATVEEDKYGFIWIGSRSGGLHKYDRKQNIFKRYLYNPRDPNSISSNMIYDIHESRSGELWISTYGGGLEKYNPENDSFIHFEDSNNTNSSSNENVSTFIYEDFSGILWIGTYFNGVNKFDFRKSQFNHITNEADNPNSLNNINVSAIAEDPNGNSETIWFGTRRGGFSELNRKTGIFNAYVHEEKNNNSLSDNVIGTLLVDRHGLLWIGTDNGLNSYNPVSKMFRRYYNDPDNPNSISSNMIKALFEDDEGYLWIATNGAGIIKYDRVNDRFNNYLPNSNKLNDDIIWCINEDKNGFLWIGTNSKGINVLNKRNEKFTYYSSDPNDSTTLSNDKVLCILRDKDDIMWIGTAGGGLNKFDPETGQFHAFTESEGLISNTVHAILEDENKNLWISTNKGITRLDPRTMNFTNFTKHDGLQSHEFHVNSALRSKTGELFFGGINGYNYFHTNNIKQNQYIPQIIFTDLKLFNKSVPIDQKIDGRVILEKSISETTEITLSFTDEVFSIEFAALDYATPELNQYAYMMEGFEQDWNYVGNRSFATYTKLPAGNYVFRVKGSNNSGIWNEEGIALHITITPSFWETFWFRLLSLMILSSVLFTIYKVRVRFIEEKRKTVEGYNKQLFQEINERKQTEKELIKAKELAEKANELKSDFLAQISHEIRSPINIVLNYLGLIKEELNEQINPAISESFAAIDAANGRIIRTIDLILNMSEIHLGIYQPFMTTINLLNDVMDSILIEYNNQAKVKGLKLNLFCEVDNPLIFGDRYSITQIFANLIDNAIKYSERGEIIILVSRNESGKLSITVKDMGIGISNEYLPHLFDEFSQEEHGYTRSFEGNGLGLALVKKYCNINRAEITVRSKKGSGTEFIITFPLER